MATFSELLTHSTLLSNLEGLGYQTPTTIQEKSIPVVKEKRDIFGIAQTGTGKTASFCLPLIEGLLQKENFKLIPTVLILTPTRELCLQTHEAIIKFAKDTPVKSCAIYGGVKQIYQAEAINGGVNFIVATPGRLLDLVRKGLIRLRSIEVLVLDEADRMLDMGFIDDLDLIIKELPTTRQTLFYSATVPDSIRRFSKSILQNPVFIEVAKQSTVAANISQLVYFCAANHKYQLLKKIIKEEVTGPILVFTRTKDGADAVVEYLIQNKISARAIHGDKKQAERERSIAYFTEGSINILVATDLVSRGIDVENIEYVINFDIPLDPEVYVHRIGRTGRAGRSGHAVTFCEIEEKHRLDDIEALTRQEIKKLNFEGKKEVIKLKSLGPKVVKAPTPGKSQEKNPWYDHSKRGQFDDAGKRVHAHPGLRNMKKKKKR